MGNRYSDLLEYVQKCLEIQYIDKQINKKTEFVQFLQT